MLNFPCHVAKNRIRYNEQKRAKENKLLAVIWEPTKLPCKEGNGTFVLLQAIWLLYASFVVYVTFCKQLVKHSVMLRNIFTGCFCSQILLDAAPIYAGNPATVSLLVIPHHVLR